MADFLQKKKAKHLQFRILVFFYLFVCFGCFCFNLKKGILLAGKNTPDSF